MGKHKLERKFLAGICLLSLFLILCTCVTFSLQYWRGKLSEYSNLAFSYARTAASYIDGDRVLYYVDTEIQDEYYEQVMHFLNSTQRESSLKYYYVFVPYEDDLVYVWDADNIEGACPLGYHEDYMEGGKEAVEKVFRTDPAEEISITRDEVYGYIASAYSPIFNSAGEPIAVVGVDLSMPGIEQELIRFIATIVLSLAVVILLSVAVFYRFVRKKIVSPINQLNQATQEMVENLEREDTFHINIHTGDEIEALADAFTKMDAEVRDYIQRLSTVTAEKERIGAELNIARHIQSSMLPCIFPAFPDRKEFDIYATMNPAKEVGGDFYDFFMVDERHLAIVIADVSGKGVPAALFMVIGKTLIKDHTQPKRDLGAVFTEVNDLLCEANSEGLFITAFEGVLDLVTGEFLFVNAGHEPPFISRGNQPFELQAVNAGFVLAGLEGIRYQTGRLELAPSDKLFQYTDGVTEATNKDDELYGMSRLTEVLGKHSSCSPVKLLPAVKADIDQFVGEAPQFDDITMLCLEYRSRMSDLG